MLHPRKVKSYIEKNNVNQEFAWDVCQILERKNKHITFARLNMHASSIFAVSKWLSPLLFKICLLKLFVSSYLQINVLVDTGSSNFAIAASPHPYLPVYYHPER